MKRFFHPGTRTDDPRNARIYARYELVYTGVDVTAALLFLSGSVLLLSEAPDLASRLCYLAGSLFFLVKPLLRMAREFAYYRQGELRALADRASG